MWEKQTDSGVAGDRALLASVGVVKGDGLIHLAAVLLDSEVAAGLHFIS
jgi:hypothetical protein